MNDILPAPSTVTEPDPGPGFRLLDHHERLRRGDEIWEPLIRRWMPYPIPGPGEVAYTPFRRRVGPEVMPDATEPAPELTLRGFQTSFPVMENIVEPGEGYRLLGVGEEVIEGDEFYYKFAEPHWRPTKWAGRGTSGWGEYRRRILPPVNGPTPETMGLDEEAEEALETLKREISQALDQLAGVELKRVEIDREIGELRGKLSRLWLCMHANDPH